MYLANTWLYSSILCNLILSGCRSDILWLRGRRVTDIWDKIGVLQWMNRYLHELRQHKSVV
jgi:hypothetical protein